MNISAGSESPRDVHAASAPSCGSFAIYSQLCLQAPDYSLMCSFTTVCMRSVLPPRSQMHLNGDRSNAVITSRPQMFQMEFIRCINFTISSSDLHTHTHTHTHTHQLSSSHTHTHTHTHTPHTHTQLITHTHTHTHISSSHTHTHTHISSSHTHTHTQNDHTHTSAHHTCTHTQT